MGLGLVLQLPPHVLQLVLQLCFPHSEFFQRLQLAIPEEDFLLQRLKLFKMSEGWL